MTQPPTRPLPGNDESPCATDAARRSADVDPARRLAGDAARAGPGCGQPLDDPQAPLRLAQDYFIKGRFRAAFDNARRASQALGAGPTGTDEVDALALAARAASALGLHVRAIELALLATHLAEELPAGLWTARAHLSLGIAHGRAGVWSSVEMPFDAARQVVAHHGDVGCLLEIETERQWARVLRWTAARSSEAAQPTFGAADELASLVRAASGTGRAGAFEPGGLGRVLTSARAVLGLVAAWTGDLEQARHRLDELAADLDGTPFDSADPWLQCARSWVEAEVARADSAIDAAVLHAGRMALLAEEAGLRPFVGLGHALASELHASNGEPALAFAQSRLALVAERHSQVLQLEGRDELMQVQVAARQGVRELGDLTARAMKFERWAHEDALTGIANLRRFNQCLGEWSVAAEDSGTPLCVALIDVDDFRVINNTFSYETGNAALRGIAQQMVAHVRPSDLPARWGGDEFVVLFRDTDLETAGQVVERIRQAIEDHDWSATAPGLKVRVSVGVTEARLGDTKESLIARSEDLMDRQKTAGKQARLERALPPLVVRQVSAWLREARRVVVFAGPAQALGVLAPARPASRLLDPLAEATPFGHAQGFVDDPGGFAAFWREWRRIHRTRKPSEAQLKLVALSHQLEQVSFVTERIDGVLAMAGAVDVLELYGNAFRDRCARCGAVRPNSSGGRCLACGAPGITLRPDIALLGERPDPRLLADAELLVKRADLVLVLENDATTYPGAKLLEMARARGARIVTLGEVKRGRPVVSDIVLNAAAEVAVEALAQALKAGPVAGAGTGVYSDEGFEAFCFLTGLGTDDSGHSLDDALGWSPGEIERRVGTLPWMFPLTTRSSANSLAPSPTRSDFESLSKDGRVQAAVRRAYQAMLRFYGFEPVDGELRKSAGWRQSFAHWAPTPTRHDLFISRILGALVLFGLKEDAVAFKQVAESALKAHRGLGAFGPLRHWELALQLDKA